MIDLGKIIERIENRVVELGTSLSAVSEEATSSEDTIRNWRRAVISDQKNGTSKASATTMKLNQIEKVLGIELAMNAVDSKISGDAAILAALKRIEGLDQRGVELAFSVITSHIAVNRRTKPSQADADGQSGNAIPHHES